MLPSIYRKPLFLFCRLLSVTIFFVGALLTSNSVSAQEDFRFQIVDARTHNNIDSAIVYIERLGRKYRTDRFGRAVLHGEIARGDTISVIHKSYATKKMVIPHSGDIFIKLDPLPVELRHVDIIAYTEESKRLVAPQTISTLDAEDFDRNSAASIQPTMNTIPGVIMESRGDGGSRRLSIRGSLMRSPFGVRNVKVYWNEFPLTLADGSTGLELIDPEDIGRVEVLKGPQGSVYGEGHGGAVLFRSKWAPYGKLNASANLQGGSNGMQKQTLSFSTSSKKTAISLNYFRYRHDGYRDQEGVRKDQLNLVTRFRPASNRETKLVFMYYNGAWGLPGALDSLEMAQNPRQARPYASEQNTRVERKWLRLGLSHKIYFNDQFYNFTAGFLHSTSKLNPYGSTEFYNGFKDEGANGYALRTIFGYEHDSESLGINLMLGGEFQHDLNALAEYDLVDQQKGELRSNDETRSRYLNVFLKSVTRISENLILDASIGAMTTLFDREDVRFNIVEDRSLRRHFQPVLLPKISMSYQLNEKYTVYALASRGISTPTLWEIQMSENLDPERSDHYELGVRGSLFTNRMLVELNGYTTRIDNVIIERPDSLGFSNFTNGGALDMRGVELAMRYQSLPKPQNLISQLNIGFSMGIQSYEYRSFVVPSGDFSGNSVPGIPLLNYSIVGDLDFKERTTFRLNYRFFDPVPLNHENTAFSQGYGVVDVRLGYALPIKSKFLIDIYFGVENLLDEEYSSFFRLNANNGRYFNPQAGRTFYGGLRFTFHKNNELIR